MKLKYPYYLIPYCGNSSKLAPSVLLFGSGATFFCFYQNRNRITYMYLFHALWCLPNLRIKVLQVGASCTCTTLLAILLYHVSPCETRKRIHSQQQESVSSSK
jgi:hypothetical protein